MPKVAKRRSEDKGPCYMGIDPGKQGGIAVIHEYDVLTLYHMPSTYRELAAIFNWHVNNDIVAIYERIWARPMNGVKQAFEFGRGFGAIEMGLACSDIPQEPAVIPQTWQKALGIPKRKKTETPAQFKTRLVEVAINMYPKSKDIIDKRTADAVLIAHYLKLKRVGDGKVR